MVNDAPIIPDRTIGLGLSFVCWLLPASGVLIVLFVFLVSFWLTVVSLFWVLLLASGSLSITLTAIS